jgi:hypothetical protein
LDGHTISKKAQQRKKVMSLKIRKISNKPSNSSILS